MTAGFGAILCKLLLSMPRLPDQGVLVAITVLAVTSFVVIGVALLASGLPPANGWTCIATAWAAVPGDLNDPHFHATPWPWLGYVLEPAYLASAVALVLRYPRGRLRRTERLLVWMFVGVSGVSRVGSAIFTGPAPDDFHRPDLGPAGWAAPVLHDWVFVRAGRAATVALLVMVALVLVRRSFASLGLERQALAPLALVTALCALAAAIDQAAWVAGQPWLGKLNAAAVRDLTAAAIPVAMLGDLLRRRAAKAAVTDRVLEAARSGDVRRLTIVLRDVLVDPSLTLAVASLSTSDDMPAATTGGWRGTSDDQGSSSTNSGILTLLGGDGKTQLTVRYNERAIRDEDLLRTALRAAAVGIDNIRLNADLLASVAELHRSRARIVEASVEERRRVERDLHDGAQQKFLTVAAILARADLVEDPDIRGVVADARTQLRGALDELRQLARGIHPPALSNGGLSLALPSLAEMASIPVDVRISEEARRLELTPGEAAAAYFVAAEALANVAKHAEAGGALITYAVDAHEAVLTIADDGNGRIRVPPAGGLAGLRERVAALDGRLTVHGDPCPDHASVIGSRVEARFPIRPIERPQ